MADDLDEFLRQAAERRKNRQQQKNARPPIAPPPPVVGQPVRDPIPTLRPLSERDAYSNTPATRSDTPAPKASAQMAPAREEVSRFPSQFDRPPAPPTPSKPKKNKSRNAPSSAPEPALPPVIPSLVPSAELMAAPSAPLLNNLNIREQIRNPQSLKAAIIFNEILKRPWQ
ncbi:hypothetical protein VN12_20145 [Pirellula sp. SH-Sr6A]|uniref:hypothetical protein n=1 Tax=Pirellula sp. SH-Sr6A TaxID=1632865 RepID=UPI00078D319A|nr:hypothetical protein [Pirellula sp. SH-Sr6A]AMV34447.1 hypothetical protein VN12_20145 [Pirellula sp. SH-Sr6A]